MGILHRHLEFNGARCVDSLSDFASPSIPKTGQELYIMVPYQTPRSQIPSTEEMAFECEVVTDMWLEKCLHARALVPPETHIASTPFPKFPIPGFGGLRVCSTGFGGIDLLHVSKLVNLMGASYDEVLTPKASVLICNDPQTASQAKLRHTREWAVPAVSADWLWISIQTGQRKPFEPYIVRKETTQPPAEAERPGAGFEVEKNETRPKSPTRDELTGGPQENGSTNSSKNDTSGNPKKERVMPIMDDGFAHDEENDAPKPSIPDSRPHSPEPSEAPAPEESGPQVPDPDKGTGPAAPSALDTALKGILQQAQAAKSRQQTANSEANQEDGFPPRRKRKPLLGRAPSHSSSKILDPTAAPSRASSIDTLNDDGLGSALESDASLSRSNSRANDQSLSSMFSGKKFDFDSLATKLPGRVDDEEDEENHEPPMTQLGYEDPDAAAMRAEFLRDAGKLTEQPKDASSNLLLGEVRELEDVGWASGRRTRRQPPKPDEM